MKPEVIIIHRPDIDFPTFLGVSTKVLGHSPGAAADGSGMRLSPTTRFLSCLGSMRGLKVGAEINTKLLPHVSISVFVIASEVDMMDILECAAGMPFVTAETTVRGALAAVVTGNLSQWKSAVVAGSSNDTEPAVRYAFNRVHGLFCNENINLWMDCRQRPAADQVTYLLEDKRGR